MVAEAICDNCRDAVTASAGGLWVSRDGLKCRDAVGASPNHRVHGLTFSEGGAS